MRRFLLRAAELAGALVGAAAKHTNKLPGVGGAVLVSWGAAMVYQPAGLIVAGVLLLWLDGRT